MKEAHGLMINDEITLTIGGAGRNGDPFGRHKGFVIFVQGADNWVVGGEIRVKITALLDSYGFGVSV